MSAEFDFLKRLGAGAFGEVWHINDLGLNAEFALKLIPPDKVVNPTNFYQEAQTLKAAEHPNIVEVYETGEMKDNRVYVKMEYLKNGSLEDEASGAFVPLTRSKKVMIDILRGLQYAHTKGIVHRDIKPANILVGNANEGKLSDFGLALPDIGKIDPSVLKEYQYILHLAPEVNKISDYDSLCDIYSCGMTLYRLINGDRYLIPPVINLKKSIRDGTFPDRTKYKEFVPVQLKRVINKALNVNPVERYQSADEMRHALERVPLYMDWKEMMSKNGMRWEGTKGREIIEVTRFINAARTWDVITRKGKNLKSLRRVNSLCATGATLPQARKFSSEVLQKYVTSK